MRTINAFMLAASLAALGGCATMPAPTGITLIDASRMAELVEVGAPQLSTTETGTLRASVSVRNRAKTRLMIEGRARFLGEAGQPLEAPTGWQALFIESESTGAMQFLSMNTSVKQVNIEIREGNR